MSCCYGWVWCVVMSGSVGEFATYLNYCQSLKFEVWLHHTADWAVSGVLPS